MFIVFAAIKLMIQIVVSLLMIASLAGFVIWAYLAMSALFPILLLILVGLIIVELLVFFAGSSSNGS